MHAATRDDLPAARGPRRKLRVTVLCGGPSSERAVSLESGRAVADALRHCGHDVFVSDIGPDQLGALDLPTDVVFPALHGTFGEDGTLQRLLEQRGIPFVGSGSAASALSMDKAASKETVRAAGLPTPDFEVWDAEMLARGWIPGSTRGAAPGAPPALVPPVIVKPVDQGSSVATFIVRAPDALLPAVREVVGGFGRALVERFIVGHEVTVGIVGRQTLPPICVRPRREFYDYTAKYQDDTTEYLFEGPVPAAVCARAAEFSAVVFERLGCRHLGRVDWMAEADGSLWFLEMNTLPGFTNHSLVPKAAGHVGIRFDELVDRLVHMALEDAR